MQRWRIGVYNIEIMGFSRLGAFVRKKGSIVVCNYRVLSYPIFQASDQPKKNKKGESVYCIRRGILLVCCKTHQIAPKNIHKKTWSIYCL